MFRERSDFDNFMLALPILGIEARPISTRGIVRIAVRIYVMRVSPQKRDYEAKVGTGAFWLNKESWHLKLPLGSYHRR